MLRHFTERMSLLKCVRLKLTSALALTLTLVGGMGCGSTVGQENDYTCNGYCNGEPVNPIIIQAPDNETACTEFLESCRGAGTCTSCS